MQHDDRLHAALARAEWQAPLFRRDSRAALAGLEPSWPCQAARVFVQRNHGFEAVASAAAPYAAWNGLRYDWLLGDYDDALASAAPPADAVVVWVDLGRLTGLAPAERPSWLAARLAALRAQTPAPLILLAWPLEPGERAAIEAGAPAATYVADLAPLASAVGPEWEDARTASISGTRLGGRACHAIARELACRWLPATLLPPVKAVAVDLDGTLYDGVLAEDGPQGVQLTAAHADLQRHLVELQRSGVLLALVTRNERTDVDGLFAARADFPLQLAHCSAIEACRDDKAAALDRIAARLRVGADAIVFLDDNAGELAAVAERLPCVTVHAPQDARHTARVLAHVAGVFRWRESREDGLRARDLAAMRERDAQAYVAGSDAAQYLQSLRVRLDYYVGHTDHLSRAAELARKTNQFNVSLRRTPEAEIAQRLGEAPTNVITVALADRLSDSGVVAAIVGRRVDDRLEVDEVCVSCRALGRRMEDAMLSHALRLMGGADPPKSVCVAIAEGPRNGPAREWLRRHADGDVPFDGARVAIPFERMVARPPPAAVHVEVHE